MTDKIPLLARLAVLLTALAVAVTGCSSGEKQSAAPTTTQTTKPAPRPPAPAKPRIVHPHNRAVPILMYHVVGTAPADAPYPGLYVSRADFSGQLVWLRGHGYHAVSLRRVYDYWKHGYALPQRPVVLTFDDGYRSAYSVALPTLRRHGWVGVLNLAVSHQWTDLPPRFVWKLRAAGWELADHTFTHPELPALDDASLEREVAESRRFLQKQYRVPVDFFCYPAGRYDAAVIAAVRRAGYLAATTTNYGLAQANELFTLKRVRVNGSDGVNGFALKMRALQP